MWPGWLAWAGRGFLKRFVGLSGELAFVEAFPGIAYIIFNVVDDWTILTLENLMGVGQLVCLIGEQIA